MRNRSPGPAGVSVRISVATPDADLSAAVWPGVSTICYPRAESAEQVQTVDETITRLEKLRGIRPGTVEVRPMIESPTGVANAYRIGSSSARIDALGVGPNIGYGLGIESGSVPLELPPGPGNWEPDALRYARSECELAARALDLDPVVIEFIPD